MVSLCDEINRFGKGISNPARYKIVEALFKGPKTVSEIVAIVAMTQPAVSQHLRTLKESQLVTDERKGQEVYYSLNSEYTLKLLQKLTQEIKK